MCTPRGEFEILRDRNPAAYETAGLSYDTKFDLRQALDLPYTTEWFSVPLAAPLGQTPKLCTLHPSLVRAVQHLDRPARTTIASTGATSVPSPLRTGAPAAALIASWLDPQAVAREHDGTLVAARNRGADRLLRLVDHG